MRSLSSTKFRSASILSSKTVLVKSMYCEMCRQAHIVNIKTGKVLGEDEDDPEVVSSG